MHDDTWTEFEKKGEKKKRSSHVMNLVHDDLESGKTCSDGHGFFFDALQ